MYFIAWSYILAASSLIGNIFGKFSEIISPQKISREAKVEIKKEDRKIEKKPNKKILIYISLLIILGIAIFLII